MYIFFFNLQNNVSDKRTCHGLPSLALMQRTGCNHSTAEIDFKERV